MTRSTLLSVYFLLASGIGVLRTFASDNWSILSLIVAVIYLYLGLRLETLLPKWKRAIQALVVFTILSNLLLIYFGADASTGFFETDALGKILLVFIFVLPTALCLFIIYQLELLSKQLAQPVIETANLVTPSVSLPLEKKFYSHKYFLLFTPPVVAIVSEIFSAVAFYLPISNATSEKIVTYSFGLALIFSAFYFLFAFYWLFKKHIREFCYTLLGLLIGIMVEYVITNYVFMLLP